MKNKYRKLAVIMLTAVCFAGCQQEDIVYPEPDAKVAMDFSNMESSIGFGCDAPFGQFLQSMLHTALF